MSTPASPRDRILVALYKFRRKHDYGPSVRDLCGMVGLSSTASINYHLDILRKGGMVEWDQAKGRTLRLTEEGRLRIPQTPGQGLAEVIGKWPGDETDEEVKQALEELG
jgi:repressor LexA